MVLRHERGDPEKDGEPFPEPQPTSGGFGREDSADFEDDGLPRGDGWWLPWLRLIVVRTSPHPTHKRCVLTHEVVHADHDDVQLAGD